jgi:hypothetical protein
MQKCKIGGMKNAACLFRRLGADYRRNLKSGNPQAMKNFLNAIGGFENEHFNR